MFEIVEQLSETVSRFDVFNTETNKPVAVMVMAYGSFCVNDLDGACIYDGYPQTQSPTFRNNTQKKHWLKEGCIRIGRSLQIPTCPNAKLYHKIDGVIVEETISLED